MNYNKPDRTVDIITMGCSKNLVDSERLLALLRSAGFKPRHNPRDVKSDVAIVNTCGFIGDAKEESIEMILQLVNAKQQGRVKRVMVMGCLSQRYLKELNEEIPEVDAWYGKFNWTGIVKDLTGDGRNKTARPWERIITTPPHSAYVKISEGCNRRCAFCAIPLITGPHTSRPKIEILDEVKGLVDQGVKEFNIIAQDLSSYGLDINHRQALPELIDAISLVPGVEWIRLHYAYPAQFPMEVLDVMASRDNVCKYLDIALQHISDKVLANMRRNITAEETCRLIEDIRSRVPDIHLRTTLMTGFPGEGEAEFRELLDFIDKVKFERMGAFAYSEEDDTWAAKKYADIIPSEEKERRRDILMERQQSISEELQARKVGSTLKVLIDRKEGENFVGRTQWDSPEVDPEVIVEKGKSRKNLVPGTFHNVKVTSSTAFELYGEVEQ